MQGWGLLKEKRSIKRAFKRWRWATVLTLPDPCKGRLLAQVPMHDGALGARRPQRLLGQAKEGPGGSGQRWFPVDPVFARQTRSPSPQREGRLPTWERREAGTGDLGRN